MTEKDEWESMENVEQGLFFLVYLREHPEAYPITFSDYPTVLAGIQEHESLRANFLEKVLKAMATGHNMVYINPAHIIAIEEIDPDEYEEMLEEEAEGE